MSLFCPSCSKEITPEMRDCGGCGYAFGPDTLNLLTSGIKDVLQIGPSERRKHLRVPRKFKVTYATHKAFVDSYLSNISRGGIFVKSSDPPKRGTVISLVIFLPDGKKELEVLGEVVWVDSEGLVTPEKTFPPGMGIEFLNLTTEEKIRLTVSILEAHA